MRSLFALALIAWPAASVGAESVPAGVQVVAQDTLVYRTDPNVPGVGIAVVAGDPASGPYTIRARFAPGTQAAPHRHPDTRTVTVLSGTYWFAQGERFDAAQLKGHAPGTVLVVPGGVAHFSAARDAETVVQESGVGPTALQLVTPPSD